MRVCEADTMRMAKLIEANDLVAFAPCGLYNVDKFIPEGAVGVFKILRRPVWRLHLFAHWFCSFGTT
jgi:hypothetical protein